MQGKVEISGVNTAKLRTLSNDEMMALIDRAQSGDEEARRKLVEGNLKLVLSVIQRFMGRGKSGRLVSGGVHRASEGDRELRHLQAGALFDLRRSDDRGRAAAIPARHYSPIRVSRSVRDTAYRVLQCKQELEKNGREPTMEEISKAMDVPLEEVVGAMDAIASPVSLYEPVYSEGATL